jgi:tetratricopeptide (TPR) repeat protein
MNVRGLVVWLALVFGGALGSMTLSEQASAQATAPTPENEAAAREAFQRGRIHYDNGEFDRAAKAFEEAYTLSRRDALLYNLYLAYRDANEQEKAAEALRNYLTRVEVIENRPQLEARLAALEEGISQRQQADAQAAEQERLSAEQRAEPASQPTPAPVQDDTASAQADARWWLMPAVVSGAGGALMLASIATGAMASGKQKELEDKCTGGVCDPNLKATADSGKTLAVVTDALLFGGAAIAATGVVLFFLKKPKGEQASAQRREPAATANFVCGARLCGAAARVRL